MTLFLPQWAVLFKAPSCRLKSTMALRGLKGKEAQQEVEVQAFSALGADGKLTSVGTLWFHCDTLYSDTVRTVRCYPNYKHWITSGIKDLLNQKKSAFQDGDNEKWRSVQQELKKIWRRAKVEYKKKVERQLENVTIYVLSHVLSRHFLFYFENSLTSPSRFR